MSLTQRVYPRPMLLNTNIDQSIKKLLGTSNLFCKLGALFESHMRFPPTGCGHSLVPIVFPLLLSDFAIIIISSRVLDGLKP